MSEIERLRAQRGTEQVTFNDIADHLRDYLDRHPDDRDHVERVARSLTAVEDVQHDHNISPTRGVAGVPEHKATGV